MSVGPRLVTVMYHYVRNVEGTPFPGIKGESIDRFRRQVEKVRSTFDTPSLEACLDFVSGSWKPGRDICLLTFDDGLRDHHDTVAQILLDAAVPGVFFLPTAALEDHEVLAVHLNHFLLASTEVENLESRVNAVADSFGIDVPPPPPTTDVAAIYRWDDPETARYKYLVNHQLPAAESEAILSEVFTQVLGPPSEFAPTIYMSWDEARSMQAAGFTMGGHTHRHKVLSSLGDEGQHTDLSHSMELLRARLGEGQRGFAYPYGKPVTYTESTIEYLADLGYSCAFNTVVDDARPGTSRWEIPRIDPKDL